MIPFTQLLTCLRNVLDMATQSVERVPTSGTVQQQNFTVQGKVVGLFIGKISVLTTIGTKVLKSGFDKKPVPGGRASITKDGVKGDEQFGQGHGGGERAVHHYTLENYELLKALLPSHDANKFVSSMFGENVTTSGMTEQTVCIGDVYRLGSATVQVTQPRKPCYKLTHRFQYKHMAKLVSDNRITGWFYKVIEEGEVSVGDSIILLDRPYPNMTLWRVHGIFTDSNISQEDLREIADCKGLADSWISSAKARLKSVAPEDISQRIYGNNKAYE